MNMIFGYHPPTNEIQATKTYMEHKGFTFFTVIGRLLEFIIEKHAPDIKCLFELAFVIKWNDLIQK